jgi:hypothetical protein
LRAKIVLKAQAQLEDATRLAESASELMASVGIATESIDMLGRAEAITKHIAELKALGKHWPALGGPSKERPEFKWAGNQEAVTVLGYRPIRS